MKQIHTEVNEMVVSDKQALTEDRDRFSCEIDRIGEMSVPTVSHSSSVTLLLSDLVVVMDQSDVEYAELIKELKTEMFSNQCC